jgi:hypothetical protein
MHAKRRKAMGPQGDRTDLLQQLVQHLDDGLGRKLCARLLVVTHGHNHASSRDLHDEVTPHEDAFHRLLHLLPVLLTANHLAGNAKAKTISEIIQGNCELFQLLQWEALYTDHQDKAAKRLATFTVRRNKEGRHPEDEGSGAVRRAEKHVSINQPGEAAAALQA